MFSVHLAAVVFLFLYHASAGPIVRSVPMNEKLVSLIESSQETSPVVSQNTQPTITTTGPEYSMPSVASPVPSTLFPAEITASPVDTLPAKTVTPRAPEFIIATSSTSTLDEAVEPTPSLASALSELVDLYKPFFGVPLNPRAPEFIIVTSSTSTLDEVAEPTSDASNSEKRALDSQEATTTTSTMTTSVTVYITQPTTTTATGTETVTQPQTSQAPASGTTSSH